LSDSGVYESLSLSSVSSSSSSPGVFHLNTRASVSLSSPHFASGLPAESFELLVMEALDGGGRSFAVDRFPSMEEGAVERYWEGKVAERRGRRDALFEEVRERAREGVARHDAYVSGAAAAGGRGLAGLGDAELLKLVDDAKGEGEEAAAAKAILGERFAEAQLKGMGDEELRGVVGDGGADPLRRRVAERLLERRGLGAVKEEL
jgi:hypothetical protein